MENRMNLNKKKIYELPDEVLIKNYGWRRKNPSIPNFEPDICVGAWGSPIGQTQEKASKTSQIWIKTDNKDLINFIKEFDFESYIKGIGSKKIECWKFKKIILEEFYNKKGEIKNDL